jgi:hypothetical protein
MRFFKLSFFSRAGVRLSMSEDWERARKAYIAHYKSIEPMLPSDVRAFHRLSLHDEGITNVEIGKKRINLHMHLYSISFLDVHKHSLFGCLNSIYLYDELDLVNGLVKLSFIALRPGPERDYAEHSVTCRDIVAFDSSGTE